MASIESNSKVDQNPIMKFDKLSYGAQICLRTFTVICTLAAMWLMLTSKQATTVYGIQMDARYSYSSAFKFFAYANAIACAFSLLSLFLTIFIRRQGSNPANYFFLFLHDLIMMSLVMAGCAAATAIGYVGRYGNSHTGWMAICDSFGKFCNRVTISIIPSYLSFAFLLMLAIISANKSRQIHV